MNFFLSYSVFQWKETSLEINDWKLKCVLETPDDGSTAAAAPAVVAVINSGNDHVWNRSQ